MRIIKQTIFKIIIIPIIFALAAPLSILMPTNVSATGNYSNQSSEKRIEMWWYYNAFVVCLQGSSILTIEESLQSDILFSGAAYFTREDIAGYYMRDILSSIGDDGIMECAENNSQLSLLALKTWGINGLTLLCEANIIYRADGSECVGGVGSIGVEVTPGITNAEKFQNYILPLKYGNKAPTLTDADKYILNLRTLQKGCAYGQEIITPKPDGSNVYEIRTFPSDNLSGSRAWIIGTKTPDTKVWISNNPNTEKSCADVASATVANAKAYGVQGACGIQYASSQIDANACINGAMNSNLTYCSSTYGISLVGTADNGSRIDRLSERTACYIGQGNDGAEECSKNITYKTTVGLWQACINGAQHSSEPDYCSAIYPAPDSIKVGGTFTDSNKSKRDACVAGQKLALNTKKLTAREVVPEKTDPRGDTNSCTIDGLGWLVCPIITTGAKLADGMFNFLADGFLKVGTSVVNTDPAKGATTTYDAWRTMQSIANVVLVIIFLIIIFSQLSGVGLSNLGVKKMLPRLVIAAIVMNLSFFLCQIAVDISNILGYSIRDFFTSVAERASSVTAEDVATSGGWGGGPNNLAKIAGGILAIAGTATAGYFLLSMFGTILIAAILALATILLILIARQAIIILAIVIAPVAIALWLLPNTKNIGEMWWKIFLRMLLLFPIVALIFGASTLASVILRDSFGSIVVDNDNVNWLGQIVAAGIMILPLFAVPFVLKGALSSIPVLGNMAGKLANRSYGNVGKKVSEGYRGSVFGRGRAIRKQGRENYRARRFAERISGDGAMSNVSRFFAKGVPITEAGRSANNTLAQSALAVSSKAEAEDIANANIKLRSMKPVRSKTRELASGQGEAAKDYSLRAAAIQQVVASNDVHGMARIWDESKTWQGPEGDKLRTVLADSMQSSSGRPAYYGQGAIAALRTNTHYDNTKTIESAIGSNAYSPEKIASADKDELTMVAHVAATSTDLGAGEKLQLTNNAQTATTDPQLARIIGKNKGQIENIRVNAEPSLQDMNGLINDPV